MSHFIKRVTDASRLCSMYHSTRQRTLPISASSTQRYLSLTRYPDSPKLYSTLALRPLPSAILLLALPGLLALPPTHPDFGFSLFLLLRSLRRCLAFPAIAPDIECHAWTSLAEVGMRVMESGFCSREGGCDRAVGIRSELLQVFLSLVCADKCYTRSQESTQQRSSHRTKNQSLLIFDVNN